MKREEKKKERNKTWERQLFDARYSCWLIASLFLNNHWFLLANFLQFIYWKWHSTVGNITLACLGQLPPSFLCSFQLAEYGKLESPWLGINTIQQQLKTSVCPWWWTSLYWIHNTALIQLLRRKFSLPQMKSVNFPGHLAARHVQNCHCDCFIIGE